MTDEYGIGNILKSHKIVNDKLLSDISDKFNGFCEIYMNDHDQQKKAFAIEASCYLLMALNDTDDNKSDLAKRIKDIIDGYKMQSERA